MLKKICVDFLKQFDIEISYYCFHDISKRVFKREYYWKIGYDWFVFSLFEDNNINFSKKNLMNGENIQRINLYKKMTNDLLQFDHL